MSISPINANTNCKHSSYLNAMGVGALGGLFAKYVLPVSKREYDTFVSTTLKNGRNVLTKYDIADLAKASRSSVDFAAVSALAVTTYTFFKNVHNKNKLA